jgi:hypothetical protein
MIIAKPIPKGKQSSQLARCGQRGYILATFGVMSVILLASIGLAVDFGTAYVIRNEAQSYCDAAALGAALELDGTEDGISKARARAMATPNKWGFGQTAFTGVSVEFASAPGGPWSGAPGVAAGVRFARVIAGASAPMIFLPLVTNEKVMNIQARAVAGQVEKTSFTNGVFPFSPFAHDADAADGHYGFDKGQWYTLRWPNNMNKHAKPCAGDKDDAKVLKMKEDAGESVQGYIDSNSAADIREAILTDEVHSNKTYAVGDPLFMSSGNKQAEERAMQDRVNQDTDTTSRSYAEYIAKGGDKSGRRLVVVPVNRGPSDNFRIAGFALFFLGRPSDYQVSPSESFCAEYVGPAVLGGSNSGGGTGSGAFSVRLMQ